MFEQPQGNRVGRWFQVGQDDALAFRPVDIIRAVVDFPERAFLGLRGEGRNGFKEYQRGQTHKKPEHRP